MTRALSLFTALSAAIAFTGCSQQSKTNLENPPVNNEQGHAGPGWRVSLKSTCSGRESADQCVAAFGFAVSADGKFIVGPGPQNQQNAGTITPEELKALDSTIAKASVSAWARLEAEHTDTCQSRGGFETTDTVTVTYRNQDRVLLRTTPNELCFQTANKLEAEELHNAIRALAAKYYPLPFPDACADAVREVEALFGQSRNCNIDTDCAYAVAAFDNQYEIVPPGNSQWVVTDSCRIVKPLAVGNITSIVNNQARMKVALDQTRETCGDRYIQSDCAGRAGFDSGRGAPVCHQNQCRVHPSIQP